MRKQIEEIMRQVNLGVSSLAEIVPQQIARLETDLTQCRQELMAALAENESAYQRGYMDGLAKPIEAALKPLTDDQIGLAWSVANGEHNASAAVKRRITRAIEAAHGIE